MPIRTESGVARSNFPHCIEHALVLCSSGRPEQRWRAAPRLASPHPPVIAYSVQQRNVLE
jgi:hypothetical protein